MSEPLVSIAIPSYNHARWLPRTIESVLAQTYSNIELVIVDDASTDDSLAVAERYARLHADRVRVLTHPEGQNHGISATLNRAFSETRGTYWGILDSDDALLSRKVERQVEMLESNPELVVVYGRASLIDADGNAVPGLSPWGDDITGVAWPLEQLFRRNPIPNLTGLARVRAIREPTLVLHRDELVYGDWDFWIRLVARGRVGFIPDVVAHERIHSYNVSWGTDPATDRQRNIAVLESVREHADEIAGALLVPHTRASLELELAFRHHEDGSRDEAERRLSAAFSLDPSLEQDPSRVWDWLTTVANPAVPVTSSAGHLAAARWLEEGANDLLPPPAEAEPERNFNVWVFARLPAGIRNALEGPLARMQLVQGATAAAQDGEAGRARRLCVRCLRRDPSLLRQRTFRYLLIQLAVGARLTQTIRRVRKPSTQPEPSAGQSQTTT